MYIVDLGRNISVTPVPSTRQVVSAQPEVLVLLDYANYQTFSGNGSMMLDYLSVFFHAVNNRYSTFTDPAITFAISGGFAFKVSSSSSLIVLFVTKVFLQSRAAQTFMEESKHPDGSSYDMNLVSKRSRFEEAIETIAIFCRFLIN